MHTYKYDSDYMIPYQPQLWVVAGDTNTRDIALSDDGDLLFVATSSGCSVYQGSEVAVENWAISNGSKSLAFRNGTLVIGTGSGYLVKIYETGETWSDHSDEILSDSGDYVSIADDGNTFVYSIPDSPYYETATLTEPDDDDDDGENGNDNGNDNGDGDDPDPDPKTGSSSSPDNLVIIIVSVLAVVGVLVYYLWFRLHRY